MNLPFDLAPVVKDGAVPIWEGHGFLINGKRVSVLEYSENFSGWSDDLMALHENSLGSSHPIDVASRQYALAQLSKSLVGRSAPVILEIGCSSGFLLEEISRSFPSAILLGGDVVKVPLVKLAERLPTVPLLRFDLLKCPLPSGILDAIIILNVLEHIQDDVAAMKQLHRLLKPGGIVIIEVPAGPHLYDAYDKALKHFRRYSMVELVAKTKQVGLTPLSVSHLGFIVYPAFCLVKWLNRWRRTAPETGEKLVQEQASRTSTSQLMRWAFSLEASLRNLVQLPWGIRCLLVAEKGASLA